MNDPNKYALDTVSWHKQFWPWLLIALLGVSVISSLVFAYIAINSQDPLVDGNYYKHGLTINERLDDIPAMSVPAQQAAPKDEQH
jgi:hypothetical protein